MILLAVTTYNQLEYTKLFYQSFQDIEDSLSIDLMIFDDASTDNTVKWCKENNITVFEKDKGKGLTDSWNSSYKIFKENKKYEYIIIANNDILIPSGALSELISIFYKWHFSIVVPLSNPRGAGHNEMFQSIISYYPQLTESEAEDPKKYQIIQNGILFNKKVMIEQNNVFALDPIRMKMFNGFFFMMNRNIIEYERPDGLLFDPKFIMHKAEDEFNWASLIPNNDYAAVCKTSFVYHFKGKSVSQVKDYSNINNDYEILMKNRR